MLRTPPANQRRNRRNRQQPQPATPTNQKEAIVYTPKLKYENSRTNVDGLLILSKRRRALPTEEEKERKRQKQKQIKANHVQLSFLQHKVVAFYEHGAFMSAYQFPPGPKSSKHIIRFLQDNYEKYEEYNSAKSFFYGSLKKYRQRHQSPHLDCFRERRGENKKKIKRENAEIVALCDEMLSEKNSTAPSILQTLTSLGHDISLSTIYRIAKDLLYRWTKPWYTDVLTPAQKLKRKLFCMRLLRLSNQVLLRLIADWLFTDEKWWDLVGPAMSQYVKAGSKKEAKTKNQVCLLLHFLFLLAYFYFCLLIFALSICVRRFRDTRAKKVALKSAFISGAEFVGGARRLVWRGPLPT